MPGQRQGFFAPVTILLLILVLSIPALSNTNPDNYATLSASNTISRSGAENLAPLQAEQIHNAGASLSRKIDELSKGISENFGGWVATTAFYGISWLKLVVCTILLLAVVLAERIVRAFIQRRLQAISRETADLVWQRGILSAMSGPLSLFLVAYGTYAALSPLMVHFQTPDGTNLFRTAAGKATVLAGTLAITWFIFRLVVMFEQQLRQWLGATTPQMESLLVPLFGRTLRMVIVLLGGIIVIQNVTGLEVGPLVASLGLGGLAVALAAKDTIANFFGTIAIIVDKPFQIGDQIVLEKHSGEVESIGFRSTRIRTGDGHLVSIPNEKAVTAIVENVGRRPYIRWHANITIDPVSSPETVKRAVQIISDALVEHEGMHEDLPPRVHFTGFKEGCLNIEVFAWYHPVDNWAYQAWLEQTCLRILRDFEREGIAFALPGGTVYLAGADTRALALRALKEDVSRDREEPQKP